MNIKITTRVSIRQCYNGPCQYVCTAAKFRCSFSLTRKFGGLRLGEMQLELISQKLTVPFTCFNLDFLFDKNDTDIKEKILKQLGRSLNGHAFWMKNFLMIKFIRIVTFLLVSVSAALAQTIFYFFPEIVDREFAFPVLEVFYPEQLTF